MNGEGHKTNWEESYEMRNGSLFRDQKYSQETQALLFVIEYILSQKQVNKYLKNEHRFFSYLVPTCSVDVGMSSFVSLDIILSVDTFSGRIDCQLPKYCFRIHLPYVRYRYQ